MSIDDDLSGLLEDDYDYDTVGDDCEQPTDKNIQRNADLRNI